MGRLQLEEALDTRNKKTGVPGEVGTLDVGMEEVHSTLGYSYTHTYRITSFYEGSINGFILATYVAMWHGATGQFDCVL